MARTRSLAFCLAGIAITLMACASAAPEGHNTASAAADVVAPAECTMIERCFPASFKAGYPGGMTDCVAKVQNGLMGGIEKCTNAQVSKCAADFEAMSCPKTLTVDAVPVSCKSC
jgi:hypothetical protein